MKTCRNRIPEYIARSLCLALTMGILFAVSGRGGETPDGNFNPEWERVRRELAATYRRVADSYIAEQPDGRLRGQVTLIVGALYEGGKMGEPDPVLAARYYQKAADAGIVEAKSALAGIYNQGAESETGRIERDPAAARRLYEEAAKGGSVPAMLALGIIYADGMNVEPDSQKALGYLMDAARRGDATAVDRLEPVMRRAREWEEAKPGRKGKANFPTSREEIYDPQLIQEFIDNTFDLDRLASHVYVEISKRIMSSSKNR